MDWGTWQAAVHGVAKSWTWLSDFTFTFHSHALEKEMASHSSVLAWRIPGTGEPGGLPSMGSHRVRHDWNDLAVAAAAAAARRWWSIGIEENSRMGMTRDLLNKIWGTKGTFHAKMGTIKDRNGMALTGAEDVYEEVARIHRRSKKIFMTQITMTVWPLI